MPRRADSRRERSTLKLSPAVPENETGIDAAVELGNAARATLGFLPVGAYRDAASKGCLLLARDRHTVVGYALYAITARRVRLIHLCVDPGRRREGIARALVERISEIHADFPGVLVRCRHDYGLGDMWIALGFTQLSEAPGRSRTGRALVRWWHDHGHPNLFTRPAESVLVRASIDLNILRDLAQPSRPDAPASLALVDDQFSDRLELVRTSALDSEIDKLDGVLRGLCTSQAATLTSVRADPGRAKTLLEALRLRARAAHDQYPHDEQDEMDLRHVAESIAAGLNVFITRDARLIEVLSKAAEEQGGLRILQPSDVIVHIDELVRAEAYRPAALLQTTYRRQLIGAGQDKQMAGLVNRLSQEAPRDFQRLARDIAASGLERVGVVAPDGTLVAAFVAAAEAAVLMVPLLRVAAGSQADTLARQVLFLLRHRARELKATTIRLTDPHPSSPIVLAALGDGFVPHDGGYYGFVIDIAHEAAEVEHAAIIAADAASLPRPAPLQTRLPAIPAAEIERRWWPAKILDSELPTFLIPIQQTFSRDLLGEPQGLFPRDTGLGLSREHVYYRSPGGTRPTAPGRLLWYMSGSSGGVVSAAGVIACSQLEDVVTGTAADLHSRFRHLGVWSIRQIEAASRNGQVQALRFTNTEIFPSAIGLKRLRELGAIHDEHAIPQGPLKISSALFAALYRQGRGVE